MEKTREKELIKEATIITSSEGLLKQSQNCILYI